MEKFHRRCGTRSASAMRTARFGNDPRAPQEGLGVEDLDELQLGAHGDIVEASARLNHDNEHPPPSPHLRI
jgi:hypothetical protein